jgi:hypothetical protein
VFFAGDATVQANAQRSGKRPLLLGKYIESGDWQATNEE